MKIWTSKPDLRLGQIIVAAHPELDNTSKLFYEEDEILIAKIEGLFNNETGDHK